MELFHAIVWSPTVWPRTVLELVESWQYGYCNVRGSLFWGCSLVAILSSIWSERNNWVFNMVKIVYFGSFLNHGDGKRIFSPVKLFLRKLDSLSLVMVYVYFL